MQLYRRKQDTDAFMELIEENMQPMYKTAWSILRNEEDVADALQETIVKGFESLHTPVSYTHLTLPTTRHV